MDGIDTLARHVVSTGFDDLPPPAVAAARTFILDSLGVGIAGSAGPWVEQLIASQWRHGPGDEARVWVRGTPLSASAAAVCNAYQIHNSEFDCVHEAAVVHPMAVLLAAVMAHAERAGGVSGASLINAVTLGVDVACHIGVASRAPLTFFRPATAGAFAATAAVGRLMGLDRGALTDAFGIACAQACGTMQAHTEGLALLGMQIGFNARNALVACDMAAAGIPGTRDVLEGPFGYYRAFEGEYDLAAVLPEVGRTWRIAEVAHKPFPSGRATHGVLDGALELQREHGFEAGDVSRIEARVPPLTHRLVARPCHDEMLANYARLSAPYVTAVALLRGTLTVEDFRAQALAEPERIALGKRIAIHADDNPDHNALTPVSVAITLVDGRCLETTLDVVYGNPAKPMTREAHLAKFRANCAAGARALEPAAVDRLITLADDLESLDDVRALVDLAVP